MLVKEDADGVRVLRLAHPPANVLSLGLLETLRGEVAAAAEDRSVRCLLLSSSLPKYFSAGLDLAEMAGLPDERRSEPFRRLLELYRALRALPKPTVAAIGGSAILGGWIVAMACDFRLLARESGRISLSEIRFGLSPSPALVGRLREISSDPRLVKEMVLRGKTLRAEEAHAGGFVDALVPEAELGQESLREAKQLARQAPAAYAAVKAALSRRPPGDEDALWQESLSEFERLFAGPEAQKGLSAFKEKRKPNFT